MAILVTGSSGFSGAHISRYLANAGCDVYSLHRRNSSAFLELCRNVPNLTLVQRDMRDVSEIEVLQETNIDTIVHVASTSPAAGITVADVMQDNILAMQSLLNWGISTNCKKFIYFSSMSAFGEIQRPIVDEGHPVVDPAPYGVSKLAAEALLADVSGTLPSLSLRLPGILGAGAHRNWLSSVKSKLTENQPVTVFHANEPFNNAVHIDDLANFMLTLQARNITGSDSVIVGAKDTLPAIEAVKHMAKSMGSSSPITAIEKAPSQTFMLNCDKAQELYGYNPMSIGPMLEKFAAE